MISLKKLLLVFPVVFIFAQECSGFNYRQLVNGNLTRTRRQANCDGFQCLSGECIEEDKECDGKVDCKDASDETNSCQRIRCYPFLFRCKYGACINKALECNGKQDCRDNSDETSPRCKRDTTKPSATCSEEQFQCNSGQCIDIDKKCDGYADCDDHSDETSPTCSSMKCPGFTYRCAYGACVNGNARCNGVQECYDGSDENNAFCTPTKEPSTPPPPPVTQSPPPPKPTDPNNCVLPRHPDFGHWKIFGNFPNYEPGMSVNDGTFLQVSCRKDYMLDGEGYLRCNHGTWSAGIGNCLPVCKSLYSSPTMEVTCSFRNKVIRNCTNPLSNTVATFKCAPFHEDLQLALYPTRICQDGSWNLEPPNCVPVCGVKSIDAQTLIINGRNVTKGDYPWQVAIYYNETKELICGGSLLNQRVILTAAHCITLADGSLIPKENYIVAVGKYFRKYKDSRDKDAQYSEIKAMFVPEDFRGANLNYFADIAILVTEVVFELSRTVQPVCVDWGLNHEVQFADPSIKGYVTGWGYTAENDEPSEVLKELNVPYIDYTQCHQDLPSEFSNLYLSPDKMCAGYLNKNTSVCRGDSGGGLVFKNRYNGRYFVTGVVSLSPTSKTGGCSSQTYGLYTKVARYISSFILEKASLYRP